MDLTGWNFGQLAFIDQPSNRSVRCPSVHLNDHWVVAILSNQTPYLQSDAAQTDFLASIEDVVRFRDTN